MKEYEDAAAIGRFSDRRYAIVNRVADLEWRRGFDEIPNRTAHGGAVVDHKESGSACAGHRGERLLRFFAKNNTEIRIFSRRSGTK